MCGIYTGFSYTGVKLRSFPSSPPPDNETIARANNHEAAKKARLRHRGPDFEGARYHINLATNIDSFFVHTRLAIQGTGASEKFQQPYAWEDIICCVNGEIYNYDSLRSRYFPDDSGYTFRTTCDSEIVLALYCKLASTCEKEENTSSFSALEFMRLLDGEFAFVLYDIRRSKLFFGTDQLGVVPLYCCRRAPSDDDDPRYRYNTFEIASEMKAFENLLGVDPCSQRVFKFPPGHYCYCDITNIFCSKMFESESIVPYRDVLNADAATSSSSGGTTTTHLDYFGYDVLMNNQISRHMSVRRYVTTLLSIKTRLARAVRKRLQSMDKTVPFGVLLSGGLDSSLIASIASLYQKKNGLPPIKTFSIGLENSPDLHYARVVADFIGSEHHEYHFTPEEGIAAIEDVIYHVETYDLTTIRASIPMFLLCKSIKRDHGIKVLLSGEGADELFGGYLYFHRAPSPEAFYEELQRKLERLHLFDCLRANKSSMAHGIEIRVPFLDNDLVRYVMRESVKEIGGLDLLWIGSPYNKERRIEKYLLREAFNHTNYGFDKTVYLPEEILWRQKEQFSDGVGYNWIDRLNVHVNALEQQQKQRYFLQKYMELFPYAGALEIFPPDMHNSVACSTPEAVEWFKNDDAGDAPKIDPSGRSVSKHQANKK